jgi:hypothetical protein
MHMETTFILMTGTGTVFLVMLDNFCLGRTLIIANAIVRVNSAHFINCCTNLFTAIIVVPLSEILDNIYQLLAHSPTCQSSLSFTPVQSVLHHN